MQLNLPQSLAIRSLQFCTSQPSLKIERKKSVPVHSVHSLPTTPSPRQSWLKATGSSQLRAPVSLNALSSTMAWTNTDSCLAKLSSRSRPVVPMPCTGSRCATPCTTGTCCCLRTPENSLSSRATRTPSCCCTLSAVGAKTTTCPSTPV